MAIATRTFIIPRECIVAMHIVQVSALPDRLREINLVGFDPAARLQGEVLSPNGTEIVGPRVSLCGCD